MRTILLGISILVCACGDDEKVTDGPGTASCPNVAGDWKVTQHCDASLVNANVAVNQNLCSLTFGAPFNQFTATLSPEGNVTLSGPQSCTGTASASAFSMNCTPGTCTVTLAR